MGCGNSKKGSINYIPDEFSTLDEVQEELRRRGFDAAALMIGIDATKSNLRSGKRTFSGRNLHATNARPNPYQECIEIIGETLQELDDDGLFPAWFFGDINSQGKGLTSLKTGNRPCKGIREVLRLYNQNIPQLGLNRPTSFAPLIYEAINQVIRDDYSYTVLIIIADGGISEECREETDEAIVKASHYPISIVMIGVGDGPFDEMERYDDELPERQFDNFQFVHFANVMDHFNEMSERGNSEARKAYFSLRCLMEVPTQYKYASELGLMTNNKGSNRLHNITIHDPPIRVQSSTSSFENGYGGSSSSTSNPPAYGDVAL